MYIFSEKTTNYVDDDCLLSHFVWKKCLICGWWLSFVKVCPEKCLICRRWLAFGTVCHVEGPGMRTMIVFCHSMSGRSAWYVDNWLSFVTVPDMQMMIVFCHDLSERRSAWCVDNNCLLSQYVRKKCLIYGRWLSFVTICPEEAPSKWTMIVICHSFSGRSA